MWQLEPRPCGPEGCGDYPAAAEFLNFGAKLQGGLPYQEWAAALVKERTEQLGRDDPVGFCKPGGALQFSRSRPTEFLQLPDLFVIYGARRDLPPDIHGREDRCRSIPPTFNGYSIGAWDGDSLVVTSNGFRDGTWIDRIGSPMSDAAKLTEKFRRVNYGRLEIEVTLDDPKVYAPVDGDTYSTARTRHRSPRLPLH